MPNPISSLVKRGVPYEVNIRPGAISTKPELAALIAEVVAAWGAIEALLGQCLGDLLHADANAAMAMYMSLTAPATQRAALDAAAAAKLKGDELQLFKAITTLAWRIYRDRNKIAHCSWGVSVAVPDGLLQIPHGCTFQAPSSWTDEELSTLRAVHFDPDLVIVYKAPDFRLICDQAYRVAQHLLAFSFCLKKQDAALFQRLSDEPDIREVLNHQRS